jgi:hypothetical protein
MMTGAQALLVKIKAARAEQAELLDTLDLWASVQAQGIVIEDVQCFGFDPKLLTVRQKTAARRAAIARQPDPVTGRVERHEAGLDHLYTGRRLDNGYYENVVYNYVKLHDGTRKTLEPMLKAP